jgi:hypothetical protein
MACLSRDLQRSRTLAKKRRKVLSETYRNRAIADFGRRAASMSAKSSHSCGVGCQLSRIGFIPFTSAALVSRIAGRQFPGGYLVTFACGSRGMFGARLPA